MSIVNYGGRLNIAGARGAPGRHRAASTGRSEKADRLTDDGRAYVRSIGGQVSIANAEISYLGFWSGRTGGLSLTGTDRPDSGALDELARLPEGRGRLPSEPSVEQPEQEARPPATITSGRRPAGPDRATSTRRPYSYVSAAITDTTVTDNAFGLFVSGANGLDVRHSSFDDNLVAGLVLHRYVVNAVVERTNAEAATRRTASSSPAPRPASCSRRWWPAENGRNGVTMSGLPLANGPERDRYERRQLRQQHDLQQRAHRQRPLRRRGDRRNQHRRPGQRRLAATRWASWCATAPEGQRRREQGDGSSERQGIALRDGVDGAGGDRQHRQRRRDQRLRPRLPRRTVESNTLPTRQHAVSLVGDVGTSTLSENTISGQGPSAIDDRTRAGPGHGRLGQRHQRWAGHHAVPGDPASGSLQPLTRRCGSLLAALLVFTAVHGARARKTRQHPYADKVSVTDGVAARTAGQTLREPAGAGAGT